jgi:hypothetical protein
MVSHAFVRPVRVFARIALCVAAALPALAQTTTKVNPPVPGKPDDPPFIMNVLALILIVGLIVGASLIPAKRSHQD